MSLLNWKKLLYFQISTSQKNFKSGQNIGNDQFIILTYTVCQKQKLT